MLESYALYSTELTDEERELGFEIVELALDSQAAAQPRSNQVSQVQSRSIAAVAYRFSETDQIVKMNVPVIGGHSYRHERLRPSASQRAAEPTWSPVGSVVFPTAAQALNSVGSLGKQLQLCH